LTRAQYDNTIRDLLGLDEAHAATFGLDEEDGGFKSNAKAPVKELQIERYQQTAEALGARVAADPGMVARACAAPAPLRTPAWTTCWGASGRASIAGLSRRPRLSATGPCSRLPRGRTGPSRMRWRWW
jgi:hypothetical protein